MFSSSFSAFPPQQGANPFSFGCGAGMSHTQASRNTFKQPSRQMHHTDRKLKVASSVARNRSQRDMKIFEKRGGSDEFERIMDVMDKRNRDLIQAREAKVFAASQFAALAEDEFENEDCCSILPVQHATQIERERLREMEERQRQIDAMEAEIAEYARLAEEEEARIQLDDDMAHSMRREQQMMMQAESRDPWDESDEDVTMSG